MDQRQWQPCVWKHGDSLPRPRAVTLDTDVQIKSFPRRRHRRRQCLEKAVISGHRKVSLCLCLRPNLKLGCKRWRIRLTHRDETEEGGVRALLATSLGLIGGFWPERGGVTSVACQCQALSVTATLVGPIVLSAKNSNHLKRKWWRWLPFIPPLRPLIFSLSPVTIPGVLMLCVSHFQTRLNLASVDFFSSRTDMLTKRQHYPSVP